MAYTKLFQKLLASSIWNEDVYTKVVWITMLCLKDQDQIVSASVGGLAHQARVPIEECRKALAILEGPDPDDSSGVREGRRIERLEHGGWLVINGQPYRDAKDEDERRAYMANYMRNYRARKQNVNNGKRLLDSVNVGNPPLSPPSDSPLLSPPNKIETDQFLLNGSSEPKKDKTRPLSPEEVEAFVVGHLGLTQNDAFWLWEHWTGNGFTVSNKKMKSWKSTASAWARMPRGRSNPYPSLKEMK